MLIRGNGWGNFSSKFCSNGVGKCDSIWPYVCYRGTFAVGRLLLPWTWAYCGCRRVAFHSSTNLSAVVPLKTNHLDDAVRSGLRDSATGSGQSPVRFPKSWPSAQCLSSCAKPRCWAHRKLVLGPVRLATPKTTFRGDCIKGGGLGRCLKGAWLGGSLQCLYRTPGDSSRWSSLLVWRPILIMSSKGESLGGGLLWTNGGESGPWGIGRAHLEWFEVFYSLCHLVLRLGKGGRLTRPGPEKASLEKELKMVEGTHHGTVFFFFSLKLRNVERSLCRMQWF